jgi:glycosyltransferase involved in cell wall biosynthesis
MNRVLHLLDGGCAWEQRVALAQLTSGSAADPISAACIGVFPFEAWERALGIGIDALTARARSPMLVAPFLRRTLIANPVELVHAWGADALAAAAAATSNQVLVTTVFDPGLADWQVNLLRTVSERPRFGIVCTAERVRRRLVERGVPYERCVVVRPGVDFAIVRDVNADALRSALGIPPEARLFTMPVPLAQRDGHCAALWAVLMRRYLEEPAILVVPGAGREVGRVRELAAASGQADAVLFTGERVPVERLIAAADDLIIGDIDEIPMTAAAWAMAASTRITAPATYATTEVLSNDLNAFLLKAPAGWRQRAARLAARLDRDPSTARICDVARGQAYEVFSRRRFVRQVEQVYANLRDGKAPAADIRDPALVGTA